MVGLYTPSQVLTIRDRYRKILGSSSQNWDKFIGNLNLQKDRQEFHNTLISNPFEENRDVDYEKSRRFYDALSYNTTDPDSKLDGPLRGNLEKFFTETHVKLSFGISPWTDWCLSCWKEEGPPKIVILGGDWYALRGAARIPSPWEKQSFTDDLPAYSELMMRLAKLKGITGDSKCQIVEKVIASKQIIFLNTFPFMRTGISNEGALSCSTLTAGCLATNYLIQLWKPKRIITWGENGYTGFNLRGPKKGRSFPKRQGKSFQQAVNCVAPLESTHLWYPLYHPASRGLYQKSLDFLFENEDFNF